MAGPIEDDGFIDDGEPFELVIGDEGPLREPATEFLRHIGVAAKEQDTFLREGGLTHVRYLLPVPDVFRLEFLR